MIDSNGTGRRAEEAFADPSSLPNIRMRSRGYASAHSTGTRRTHNR
jgi:hypothetical protein